ncbi:sterol-4-alpha-carboxylate 3-dehydrogenase like protein [Amylocarpus encephaloides]|uniref:Sterol-4-alpha-carboxylate 3-dehydrogenase ERG26, decarboxylating n=1 Tax=Amylocarpus encephaloides TaxID=45428 RepID=A0A9P7YFL6_9HELO|nr:sterol-4-alpha-carboxylate 3-dehydrogenase like protein [Amylocarpus encephaloides]
MATAAKKQLGNVLVIGGCGFLGHHIVNLLLESYTSKISVLDVRTTRNRRPDTDGVSYYDGDITSLESLIPIFEKIRPDVVIHTASPTLLGGNKDLYYKVNVQGTKCVVEACKRTGVKGLVYTSSASVVSDNATDLINADERWPVIPPESQTEYYSQTKGEAEAYVLGQNRASDSKLLTCALRPAGIFGEGDVQLIPPMIKVFHDKKTNFQLGENTNLFDFTYVRNVAHAHLLAANYLLRTSALSTLPLDHERIDGEFFFVTNCEPIYFWDFPRMVWKCLGLNKGTESVWVISKEMGNILGTVMDWTFWAVGKKSKLTRREVKYSCMTRYYDCSKAKQRLGYEPLVGLEEGIKRSVQWFQDLEKEADEKKGQ